MALTHTFIYIDDDQDDKELLSDALFSHPSIRLITLSNGDQLFQLLSTADALPVCLVMLDMNLPGQDGLSICRELKALTHHQHTPIVIFTTASYRFRANEMQAMGIEMIQKPSSYDGFTAVADRMLQCCSHTTQNNIPRR